LLNAELPLRYLRISRQISRFPKLPGIRDKTRDDGGAAAALSPGPRYGSAGVTAPGHLDGQGSGAVAVAWRLRAQIELITASGREVAGQTL
jgi:hypothetical protein